MMHTPAHKSGTAAQTLSDYIKDVVESEKRLEKEKPRLTFEEWYVTIRPKNGGMPWDDWFICMREAWNASRENM